MRYCGCYYIARLGSYSGPTCALLRDHDHLAFLAWARMDGGCERPGLRARTPADGLRPEAVAWRSGRLAGRYLAAVAASAAGSKGASARIASIG